MGRWSTASHAVFPTQMREHYHCALSPVDLGNDVNYKVSLPPYPLLAGAELKGDGVVRVCDLYSVGLALLHCRDFVCFRAS